jgi:hypothetical protein
MVNLINKRLKLESNRVNKRKQRKRKKRRKLKEKKKKKKEGGEEKKATLGSEVPELDAAEAGIALKQTKKIALPSGAFSQNAVGMPIKLNDSFDGDNLFGSQ